MFIYIYICVFCFDFFLDFFFFFLALFFFFFFFFFSLCFFFFFIFVFFMAFSFIHVPACRSVFFFLFVSLLEGFAVTLGFWHLCRRLEELLPLLPLPRLLFPSHDRIPKNKEIGIKNFLTRHAKV